MPGFFRRKVLIRPSCQYRLAATLFIYIIAYSAILGFLIFYPLYSEMDAAASIDEQLRISSLVLYLHKRIWIGLFLVALLAAVHTIYSTHKIIGPMPRVEGFLKDLIGDHYGERITLRKGDEFKELEELLNDLSARLQAEKEKSEMEWKEAKAGLEAMLSRLEAGASPPDIKRELGGLISRMGERR